MPLPLGRMFYLRLLGTTEMTKVAVCMGSYNRGNYLKELLMTLVNQTFKDFSVYILDDGSTDNSKEVIESYRDKLDLHVCYGKGIHNIGTVKNKVVGMALRDNPKYIQMVDGDDLLESTFLEEMVSKIEKGYDFVVCDGVTFGDIHKDIRNHDTDSKSIEHLNPFLSWIMIRSDVMKEYNYRVGLGHYEDWDLHIRLIKGGKRYGIVDKPLYNYRMHSEQFHKVTEQEEFKHRLNLWQLNNINTVS